MYREQSLIASGACIVAILPLDTAVAQLCHGNDADCLPELPQPLLLLSPLLLLLLLLLLCWRSPLRSFRVFRCVLLDDCDQPNRHQSFWKVPCCWFGFGPSPPPPPRATTIRTLWIGGTNHATTPSTEALWHQLRGTIWHLPFSLHFSSCSLCSLSIIFFFFLLPDLLFCIRLTHSHNRQRTARHDHQQLFGLNWHFSHISRD